MFDPNVVSPTTVVVMDVKQVAGFLYWAIGGVISLLVGLVIIAWRAGGDVREIKNAVHEHGPAITDLKAETRSIDKRLVVLETMAGVEQQAPQTKH